MLLETTVRRSFMNLRAEKKSPKPDGKSSSRSSGHDDGTAEELDARFEQLRRYAQLIGGSAGIVVSRGKPGEGSYCDLNTSEIVLDPCDVEGDFNRAVTTTGHEGAHARISAPLSTRTDIPPAKLEALSGELGYRYLHNVHEDPAVNNWLMNSYPGVQEPVKRTYQRAFENENAELGAMEAREFKARNGYFPRFGQAGAELIRAWATGRTSKKLDPAVQRYVKTHVSQFQESVLDLIPRSSSPDRAEILDSARARAGFVDRELWEGFKELVELDLADEQKRQLAKKEHEKGSQSKLSAKARADIKETVGDGRDETVESGETTSAPSGKDSHPGTAKRGTPKQSDKEEGPRDEEHADSADLFPLDPNKLSAQTRKELEKLLDDLTPAEREEIRKQATETLAELERRLRSQLRGKFEHTEEKGQGERIPINFARAAAGATRPRDPNQDPTRAELLLEADSIARHGAGTTLANLTFRALLDREGWQDELAQVYPALMSAISRLQRVIEPDAAPEVTTAHPSGFRPDLMLLLQAKVNPLLKTHVWQRRALPFERSHSFLYLFDVSTSMDPDGLASNRMSAVFLSELSERLQVPFECHAFSDSSELLKSFSESIRSAAVRERIINGVGTAINGTSDADAIETNLPRIANRPAEYRFLYVISDGKSGQETKLAQMSTLALQQGVILVHFGIETPAQPLYHLSFGNLSLDMKDSRSFFKTICDVTEKLILFPEQLLNAART